MPEWQDSLYRGDWVNAYTILADTNPFPEFTGRVCPALCEASCVLGIHDEPVTIRHNELAVIEKAYELGLIVPKPPRLRNDKKIAVVGAGPAGLATAYYLNRAGFSVTVYEGDSKPGGYLRYGIPDFKLDKSFIDRRIALMEIEGVVFKTNTRIGSARYAFGLPERGTIIEAHQLEAEYDLVILTIGAREPRDIAVPGRESSGIVQALDYLSLQNRQNAGDIAGSTISAYGKRVVVIGGGDTGSDCVGTANRQGALKVTQIEVMPKPPSHRGPHEPWPLWPTVLKTSSSHLEGSDRLWTINTKSFIARAGAVEALHVCRVEWTKHKGKWLMNEIPGSDFEIRAELILLAMGFTHVVQNGIVKDLGLATDERGNVRTQGTFHTSNPKVWAAGDSRRGASLVVHAIADGRAAAEAVIRAFA
jgi:glutamate synthase (NADPH/NADH) small chain